MPVLESDFLKGIIDPHDHLHKASLNALKKIREQKWSISAAALLELDLLLKQSGIGVKERFEVFEALRNEIRPDRVLGVTPAVMSEAVQLQNKHRSKKDFYFDSIHIAIAILYDGVIVSSDRDFDQVAEVRRLSLSEVK